MMPFILLGWLLAVSLAIWWPRRADEHAARTRAYRTLRDAASCLLPGYISFSVLIALLLDVRPGDWFFLVVVRYLAGLGALMLTPYALGMVGLDIGNRPLGLGSSVLAALCAAGLACYGMLLLLNVMLRAIPVWYAVPAFGAALFCGASAAFVLEAYAVMRAPSSTPPEKPEAE
jgi:hypothetical protein